MARRQDAAVVFQSRAGDKAFLWFDVLEETILSLMPKTFLVHGADSRCACLSAIIARRAASSDCIFGAVPAFNPSPGGRLPYSARKRSLRLIRATAIGANTTTELLCGERNDTVVAPESKVPLYAAVVLTVDLESCRTRP